MSNRTRALWGCTIATIGLVAFRSFAMLAYEQLDFDFDQAVVGLMVARHIRYGSAVYWDAYITVFLAGERVILNSNEKVRISVYEARVTNNAAVAATIVRQPCTGGRRVASWCVIDPLNR